jgi:hypothetical protein
MFFHNAPYCLEQKNGALKSVKNKGQSRIALRGSENIRKLMNRDVTKLVFAWAECSRAVWCGWFKDQHNATDRFLEVESALFRALVADEIAIPSIEPAHLEVMYQGEVNGLRQVCRKQKAGNIFCDSQNVLLNSTSFYKLKAIDLLGTMMDGKSYAEVVYHGEAYILEPIKALRFFVRTPD